MTLERQTIADAIRNADGNITDAAHALGCSRRTLTNRMRAYGMPYGKSGRRKRALPYGRRRGGLVLVGAAAALAIGYVATRARTA